MYQVENTTKPQVFDKRYIQKLVKNDALEILSTSQEKGAIFQEHTSPKDTTMILQKGAIVFDISAEVYPIKKFEHFSFTKEEKQGLEALKDSKYLITC